MEITSSPLLLKVEAMIFIMKS